MTVYTLDEVVEITNGGSWTEAEYSDSEKDIYVVKVTNMVNGSIAETVNDSYLPESLFNKYKNHQLKSGDICIATVGSHPSQQGSVVGRTIKVQDSYSGSFLNQNAAILRPKDESILSNNFFYYLTKTIFFKHHVESRARGSANQVRMAIGELKRFSFNYPEIQTQKKVAAILSAYDDLIENNKKRIQILENMAEELYKEWFVRFRFPNWENTEFEKGLPSDWSHIKLSDILELKSGYAFKSSIYKKEGTYGLLTIKNVHSKRLKQSYTDYIVESENTSPEYCALKRSDILMSLTGNVGRVCRFYGKPALLNQRVCKIVAKNKYFDSFIYEYFQQENILAEIDILGTGTAQQNLSPNDLKKMKVLFPEDSILQKFHSIINPAHEEILLLLEQNMQLIEIRDSLLPKLISGKLSVENLDIQFPPSMQEQ